MSDPATTKDITILGKGWKWLLALGIVYVLLGVLAFSMPIASSYALTLGLSVLLLAGGIASFIHAVQLRHHRHGGIRFFQAAVAIVAGGLMLRYPGRGMVGVALALSFYFFISAAAQMLFFIQARHHEGWGWGIASSIISFCLGVYIIVGLPFSALWVPGTLLGIDFVFAGVAMIGFSISARNAYRNTLVPMEVPGSLRERPLRPTHA